ncbi:hypothetical protein PENSOL_c023G01191 [Penicillium solitum]|uniref:NADH-cytochrome b5 reductase 1 n=1 Tax=Penicillium solitum TaxID=60172 RepID=A0A1V6R0J1_9EURO|nr:uncharacterized protein PENSOL_c023G01191 [Penicillium solitum]OQD94974.1 hypothetical protein PENSOL_c023G01191 [Penicillium solitum]
MYTLEEVQQHNKPDDIWIVLHNKVYDVTKYLEDHPGGSAILIEVGGTDATEAFEETGHSDEAREELVKFHIGDLPSEEHAETIEVYRPTFEEVAQTAVIDTQKGKSSRLRTWTITLIKLGLTGALGVGLFATYRGGVVSILPFLKKLSTQASAILRNKPSSSGRFWTGVGMASAAQLSLTIGLATWISTRLDVQQEFTHYPAHRTTRPDKIVFHRKLLPSKPSKATKKVSPLDPRQWKSFPLAKKELISPNVYRLDFSLPNADDVLGLPTGQHIALRADINGKSVSRSYTPISNNTDLGRIELLVKVYPQGQMTKHLEQMKVGDTIDIRGPKGAMQYNRSYAKHIGMIAGGTGITPMYQLIRAICDDKADSTRIDLLCANNTEEDILLRVELDNFAARFPDKFRVQYVLSKPAENWVGHRGFVTQDLMKRYLPASDESNRALLCGPPPMVNAMKKTLVELKWKEPGALSKATDQVFLF